MAVSLPDTNWLAADRTRLAYERTLMAWIRTATSLISFGFTIYKFFQYLRETAGSPPPQHALGPHTFAILMILIGLAALTLAWVQHRQAVKALGREFGNMPHSLAGVIAAFIAGLGIVALIGVTLRL
ncbi:MAG: DUF202 domain-containing protein [Gemmataceae bacterium]